jgi:death-on-curing protein
MQIRFLTLAEVLQIYADQVRRRGGAIGVRDPNGLLSALAMPEAGVGGERFHSFPWGMAAAYAFHLCRNHPFVDGNKRVALAAALIFLVLNGVRIEDPESVLFGTMVGVAEGRVSKSEFADLLAKLAENGLPPTS